MKTIIAGPRSFTSERIFHSIIKKYPSEITEVVCGMARGVDMLGYKWAKENGIPVKEFPADWEKYGKRAGPIRNKEMEQYADAAIIIWDGQSKGTKSMLNIMIKSRKPTWLVKYEQGDATNDK